MAGLPQIYTDLTSPHYCLKDIIFCLCAFYIECLGVTKVQHFHLQQAVWMNLMSACACVVPWDDPLLDLGVFLACTQCSLDKLYSHCSCDQIKVIPVHNLIPYTQKEIFRQNEPSRSVMLAGNTSTRERLIYFCIYSFIQSLTHLSWSGWYTGIKKKLHRST